MTILNAQHWRGDILLSEQTNIPNTLHGGGEQYILKVVFQGTLIPVAYYLGLDNRQVVSVSDTLASLVQEPTGNGYTRQPLMSNTNNFIISQSGETYIASTSVVTFTASGSSWGPVQNLFLATTLDNSGVLISTAPLTPAFSVSPGDQILMRLSMSLGNPS
jgi:hypothetical protein